jgi:CheY-like chemotaxis protein
MATILVVDDDPDVNDTVAAVLTNGGHSVLSAANGKKALAVLEDGPAIDLMLTDVVMPEMDGVTLSYSARALRPGLPVIFVSAYVDGMVLPEGRISAFVRKPWRARKLLDEIENLLTGACRDV